MGIYIKGMNMPKDCIKCPLCLFADGYWKCLVDGSHADFGGTCRPPGCPLDVPPHGRLIDSEELKELFRETITGIATRTDMKGAYEHMIRASAMVIEMIDDAPTVIEASEVDNES